MAIVYAIRSCSVNVGPGVPCSETFDLYKYERDVSLPEAEVKPDLFTDKVKTIRAGPRSLRMVVLRTQPKEVKTSYRST